MDCEITTNIFQTNFFLQFHKVFHVAIYIMVLRHAVLLECHVAIREHHTAIQIFRKHL